jgi:hypothetical protein
MGQEFISTDSRKGHEVFLADVAAVSGYFMQYFDGLLFVLLRGTGKAHTETFDVADPSAADLHPFPNRSWASARYFGDHSDPGG